MAIIKCPECGHQVSDKAATCPSCGIQIAGRVTRCPECGAVVFKDQELCPNCHYPLHDHANENAANEAPAPAVESSEKSSSENPAASAAPQTSPSAESSQTSPSPESPATVAGRPQPRVTPAGAHRRPTAGPVPPVVPPAGPQTPDDEGDGTKGKSHKKSYAAIVVTIVIVLIVAFVAVYFYKSSQQNSEMEAYTEAMASNDPAVLQNYLDIYKNAPEEHRDSIQAHLDLLMNADRDWTDAVVSGSKTALEHYIETHPNSPHLDEAKAKIDSLDWISAQQANTTDALQAYMDAHANGLYFDQAKALYDKLDAKRVSDTDRQTISALFSGFFRALAANDEDGATAGVANVMDSFLHKAGATKNDVLKFMAKLHADAGEGTIVFRTNNDWNISKQEMPDGSGYAYTVSFSVDQTVKSPAADAQSGIITYKVDAKVSPDGKITTLNLKKMVQ